MKSVTSGAVKTAIDAINHQGVKYGNYDCNTIDEGLSLIDGDVLNSPYKQGIVGTGIMYLLTVAINPGANYRFQLCITYGSNIFCVRNKTDGGWSLWVKLN